MENCIFCKIVRGEVPGMKVLETEHTLAFMDIARDVDGHILVIPRKHCKSILDCDEVTLGHLMETVRQVSRHLTDHCGYDGVNLLNASGESAGQSVPHFHIHIIPRKTGDGLDTWPSLPGAQFPVEETFRRITMK